jgi:hypothetical protein
VRWGFAFDPGACGVSEHLLPRSGEQAGHRRPREALSEAEAHARGRDPRARWELSRGACETWVPLGPHRPGSRSSPTSESGLPEDPPTC